FDLKKGARDGLFRGPKIETNVNASAEFRSVTLPAFTDVAGTKIEEEVSHQADVSIRDLCRHLNGAEVGAGGQNAVGQCATEWIARENKGGCLGRVRHRRDGLGRAVSGEFIVPFLGFRAAEPARFVFNSPDGDRRTIGVAAQHRFKRQFGWPVWV